MRPSPTICLAHLFPLAATAFTIPIRTRQLDPTTDFDWTAITPTPDLQYHPCYNNTFHCARLQVPLDWSRPGNASCPSGPHAAIALVTLPATVPPTSPSYAGPILINPGGPGGSGTQTARGAAALLQALVDVPGERHYDIVGFDPRGVALTTPSASCYGREADRVADRQVGWGVPSLLTEQGLRMAFGMGNAAARLCEGVEVEGSGEKVFRFLSTASVARDMLEIVERSHELVRKAGGDGWGAEEKPRLQYLGFSYGSVVGSTFASMFPDRVGRMVLDGIVDGEDYMTGAWQKNIIDAEAAVDAFYRTCFDADAACPLRQPGDTSFADIRARVDALLLTLQQSPVVTVHNNRVYPVTSYLVSEKIRTSLYAPISGYEPLAHSLAGALAGNFSTILSDPAVMGPDLPCADTCATTPTDPPQTYTFTDEVLAGIICGDSQASTGTTSPPQQRDLAWAASTVARLTNQSTTIGEAWAKIPLACADWPAGLQPAYGFAGPFGSPAPDGSGAGPAAPVLILSTRTDLATPLSNAYALSRVHGGSAVVVLEAVGHCALLAAASACVGGIVREYFRSGAVPANGTVCEADCVPAIPATECPGLSGP